MTDHTEDIRARVGELESRIKSLEHQFRRPPEATRPGTVELVRAIDRRIDAVCKFYGVTRMGLLSKCRVMRMVWCRFTAIHLLGDLKLTTTQIGEELMKDHTLVCYARRAVQNRLETDPSYVREVESIRGLITPELTILPKEAPTNQLEFESLRDGEVLQKQTVNGVQA
jgi:chromosomal replication initiation ATPase DnaA